MYDVNTKFLGAIDWQVFWIAVLVDGINVAIEGAQ
jgi:hypothetical protein